MPPFLKHLLMATVAGTRRIFQSIIIIWKAQTQIAKYMTYNCSSQTGVNGQRIAQNISYGSIIIQVMEEGG